MGDLYNPQQVISFSPQQANRIAAAVKKVEKIAQPAGGGPSEYRPGVGVLYVGKLTSALTYNSSNSPSTWTATFQPWFCASDPFTSSNTESADTDYSTLTVYPWGLPSPTTIASGTACIVGFVGGRWYVLPTQGMGILAKNGSSAITIGNSGTVTVYSGTPGSETSTSVTVTAWNMASDTVPPNQFCWLNSNGQGLYVTSSAHKARWISGTVGTKSAGASASVSVSAHWDGSDPGSSVTAYDPESAFTVSSTKTCRCCYNPESDQYEFVWVVC